MTKKCSKCKEPIQEARLKALPGTTTCVNCSDAEAIGCVDIVYHKTGNTIQIMPQEQAAAINKAAKRTGFGSMLMRGGSGGKAPKGFSKTSGIVPRQPTTSDFEDVGKKMMEFVEFKEEENARNYIKEAAQSRLITPQQYRQLKEIIQTFFPKAPEKEPEKRDEKVDDEITSVFRNWRNSKNQRTW